MFSKLSKFLLLLIVLVGSAPAIAREVCKSGANNSVFSVCYDDGVLEYFCGSETIAVFEREGYENQWAEVIRGWFAMRGIGASHMAIKLFVAVPEINPCGAQIRLQVEIFPGAPQVVIYGPLDPAAVDIDTLQVAVLKAGESYPSSFGYKAESLLLQAQRGVTAENLNAALRMRGYQEARDLGGGYFRMPTRVFAESGTKMGLEFDSTMKSLLLSANLNQIYEWIAERFEVIFWQG